MDMDFERDALTPIEPDALREILGTEALRFYGIDEFYLERTGLLRLSPGEIDIAELVWGIAEDDRLQAAAYLLRLLQAPLSERMRMTAAMEEALTKHQEIYDVVSQVAGSEQKQTYMAMYDERFGEAPTRGEMFRFHQTLFGPDIVSGNEMEFVPSLTSVPSPSLHAYVERLRAGIQGEMHPLTPEAVQEG